MRAASNAENEAERKGFENLACTWAQAALMSNRRIAPHFTSALRVVTEAMPLTRS
ncbi:MAG TPA: hypothetical protein VHE81_05425 [Lacipirellulaceae bacterium]|nr:hypothetical protein [Lacipirellulaceae bacterium]